MGTGTASASSSRSIESTSRAHDRVSRVVNGLLFSSLYITVVTRRLARRVDAKAITLVLVDETKSLSHSFLPTSTELLVRFPNTEEVMVE
jgi:hypothetical protein